ncbi:MAG: helix-turn-helix transcriptional regulator [Sphingomonadales bacterium]|nr:helix-turn-helix transcriptional regulator [Sphingomonadales bacterium]
MITPNLCRAARHLLGWRQEVLAERAEVSVTSIRRFESGRTSPHRATLKALKTAFEDAGIEFIDDDGIGLKLKR